MALRIKELLYEDQYTIAGAKKRLTHELRGGGKLKSNSDDEGNGVVETKIVSRTLAPRTAEERQGLKQIAAELRELLSLLEKETKNKSK